MLLIKALLEFFNKSDFRSSIVLIVMMVFTAFIEFSGIGLLFPYLKILDDRAFIHNNHLVATVYRYFSFTSDDKFLLFSGVFILTMIVLKGGMSIANNFAQAKLTYRITDRLSKYYINEHMKLPFERFLDTNSSVLSKHLLVDIFNVALILQSGFSMITDCIVTVTLIALMIWVAARLVFVVMGTLAGLLFVTNYFTKKRMKQLSSAKELCDRNLHKMAFESFSALKEAKVYNVEPYFVARYLKWRYKLSQQMVSMRTVANIPANVLNVSGISILLIVLLFLVIENGNLMVVLPTIGILAVTVQRLLPPVVRISDALNIARTHQSSAYILRDVTRSFLQHSHHVTRKTPVQSKAIFTKELVLKNIFYRYPGSNINALDDVSLIIKKGFSIGIVGESGSGKSTLVDLLLGLLSAESGSITCDGVDLIGGEAIFPSHLVSYVPQQVFLLDASIRENIAFGVPLKLTDESAIEEAITIAQLREFINSLPGGLNTNIGEAGIKISGGERQRIGIARALYRKSDILIMDEGTNALDLVTEKALNDQLILLMERKTLIIIAHRLSSVKICDYIIQLDKGRIVASGCYDDLGKTSPLFQRNYGYSKELM